MSEPLLKLLEYADMADDSQYGTVSSKVVRDLVNEALAQPAQAPAQPAHEPAQACEHCGESEPWVGLCDHIGDLCGLAAAKEWAATAQPAQPAQAPAQPAPSDPLQLMADDARALGLGDDLGAIQPAPQPSTDEAVERVMAKLDLARQNVETVLRVEDGLEIGSLRKLNGVVATLRSAVEALAKGETK